MLTVDEIEHAFEKAFPRHELHQESVDFARAVEAAVRARFTEHIQRLEAENANLRSVMVAAAEEISAHWEAHCDDEGYGPTNLMHRLEKGIPTEHAYTAGDFARLKDENEALKKDAQRLDAIERNARCDPKMDGNHVWWPTTWKHQLTGPTLRAAIDAAMTKEQKT